MDAIEYLDKLRERWLTGSLSGDPDFAPYFSAEGKARRRKARKLKHAKVKGEPIAGTGSYRYSSGKWPRDEGPRSRRERSALRYEDKAN